MSTSDASALAALGARLATRAGRPSAADFGDPAAEAEALATRAGAVPLAGGSAWDASGKDARGFLHRMLTQDVATLGRGEGRPSLFLDVRGRVQGDPFVWAVGDRFVLAQDPAAAARTMPALERYVIADDVALADASESWSHALVAGPGASAALERASPALRPMGASFVRSDLFGLPAWRALVPAWVLPDVLATLRAAGVVLAGEDAFDVVRVEVGIPWSGTEIDDRILPNEAGLDASISWTKGCYLGQEPVVMARDRGHPASLLGRFSIAGDAPPAPGAPLLRDGRPVGRLATVARTTRPAGLHALGFVRFDAASPGASFAVEGLATSATLDALLVPAPAAR